MKIIHFCSYFQGSKVYSNLFSFLNKLGVTNYAFVPVKRKIGVDVNDSFFFSNCLGGFTRFFYSYKLFRINKAANANLCSLPNDNYLIHAHTLYADGIPAYRYAKKRGLPLVITIRTTDASLGFRYYFQYKWLARKALGYANKIVFVAPAHKLKFQKYFGHYFDSKLIVMPNGIDDFYHENILNSSWHHNNNNNVALYVGAINKNKNLKASITAFFSVSKSDDEFRVVGGTYEDYVSVYGELPVSLVSRVTFLGKLSKEQVLEQMRVSSLFIMVSHSETFGLVYVEAISQCLPIVYTSGQGVDGYFADGEYGFKANSSSVESISTAIKNTLQRFPDGLGPFEENPAVDFSWDRVAEVYMEEIYK